MRKKTLIEYMNMIDDEIINEAGDIRKIKKNNRAWIKYVVAAAGIILLIKASNIFDFDKKLQIKKDDIKIVKNIKEEDNKNLIDRELELVQQSAGNIIFNGRIYFAINMENRIKYDIGTITRSTEGNSLEKKYDIKEKDLGEYLGKVEISGDKGLIGKSIYRFSKVNDDNIYIVGEKSEYEFYVFERMVVNENADMREILEAYELINIDNIDSIDISNCDENGEFIYEFSLEKEDIANIIHAIEDMKSVSMYEHNNQLRKVWDSVYGEKNKNGRAYYKIGEEYGNIIFENEKDNEKFLKLLGTSKGITINHINGYSLNMTYSPVAADISCTSFFIPSEKTMDILNKIMKI